MLSAISRYGARVLPNTEQIVAGCKARGELIQGPQISQFEAAFARRAGMEPAHAVAASYGRMAFYYILKALNLPPLGNPGRASPLLTKTLLFVGEGDLIMARAGSRLPKEMPIEISPGAGGKKFRAFDKATGAVLWETELPEGTTGVPMTYLYQGKQFIVVPVGSTDHDPEFIALSLP